MAVKEIAKDVFVRERTLPVIIDYVQGTTAIPITLNIRDYEIPSGSEARIYLRKTSGKEIYNSALIKENAVTITPTTQMFAESGEQKGQLQIISGSTVLFSFLIIFRVEENLLSESAIESSDEYTLLETLIETARQSIAEANTATKSANAAANLAASAANEAGKQADAAQKASTAATDSAQKANESSTKADTATKAANEAAASATAAAKAAQEAAEKCAGLTDNSRVSALEEQMTKVIEALSKTLAIEE